jgi:hypothetical protein
MDEGNARRPHPPRINLKKLRQRVSQYNPRAHGATRHQNVAVGINAMLGRIGVAANPAREIDCAYPQLRAAFHERA